MSIVRKVTTTGGGLLLLVVAVVCLNIIASRVKVRLDATGDKVFSLSDGTKKILGKLDAPVTAHLYFSRSMKDLPVMVKTYATRVEEVLSEYASRSGQKLTMQVIDPKPDTEQEEQALRFGVTGVRMPRGDQMFFGVVFVSGAREIAIPYLDPRREEFLEYDLSEALVRVFNKEQPKVGVLSSLPVDGPEEPWVAVTDLRRNFAVQSIAMDAKEIPADLKVLIVLHPKSLPETLLYAIDQYVLGGGRLIVAVDPFSRVDLQMNAAAARQGGQMPQASSELDKLFAAWGVEYDKSKIVGDASYVTQINAGGPVVAYPFFLSLPEAAFSRDSVITSNLRQMLVGEGGAFAPKEGTGFTFEPLIKTTKDSGIVDGMLAGFMMPQDLARDLKVDGKERVLAAMVRGKFKSAFPAALGDKPHKAEADAETSVVLVGDVDFLADQNAAEKFRFGSQTMVRVKNDNLSFLFNAADFLGGSQDLISIRTRGRIARPFTKVAELQKNAQIKWQAEEEKLNAQLADLQKKLNEIQQQRTDGNRFVMSKEQQEELKRFRAEEAAMKKRRREVRKGLREDIEALGNRLVALNMLSVPLAASVLGIGVFLGRSRRKKEARRG